MQKKKKKKKISSPNVAFLLRRCRWTTLYLRQILKWCYRKSLSGTRQGGVSFYNFHLIFTGVPGHLGTLVLAKVLRNYKVGPPPLYQGPVNYYDQYRHFRNTIGSIVFWALLSSLQAIWARERHISYFGFFFSFFGPIAIFTPFCQSPPKCVAKAHFM